MKNKQVSTKNQQKLKKRVKEEGDCISSINIIIIILCLVYRLSPYVSDVSSELNLNTPNTQSLLIHSGQVHHHHEKKRIEEESASQKKIPKKWKENNTQIQTFDILWYFHLAFVYIVWELSKNVCDARATKFLFFNFGHSYCFWRIEHIRRWHRINSYISELVANHTHLAFISSSGYSI